MALVFIKDVAVPDTVDRLYDFLLEQTLRRKCPLYHRIVAESAKEIKAITTDMLCTTVDDAVLLMRRVSRYRI